MSSRIRIALVGTGGIAGAHVNGLKPWSTQAELVACVDVDAARVRTFASEHHIAHAFTDTAEMLRTIKPDLVAVATPPKWHTPVTVQCLEAGAWVLCEKPLCASLAEMDQIQAAEERTGNYCSCVFQFRFGSSGQHVKQLIEQSAFGKMLVGQCVTTWFRDHEYYAVPWRGKWATELGGPTMIHGIHAMDMLLWLAGPWRELQAMMGTLDRRIDVEDVSMAMVRFESGALVNLINTVLCPRQETWMRLDFHDATVEVRHLYGYADKDWQFTRAPHVSEAAAAKWSTFPPEQRADHAGQYGELLQRFCKRERPRVSGAEARATIEFLTSLYKSAITGQQVTRGSIGPGDAFYGSLFGGNDKPLTQLIAQG